MGVQELLIVFAILLLFFGAKKLPGLAGSLGTSIKEFRKGAESDEDEQGTSGSSRAGGKSEGQAERDTERGSERESHPVDRDVER